MEQEIKKILSKLLSISPEEISDSTSMKNVKKWDSLKHLEIVMALEEHFDFRVTMDEIVEMINFKGIKDTVARYKKVA